MSNTVIKVENLSKRYRIGSRETGYSTFRETLVDAARAPFQRLQGAWRMAHRAWSKRKDSLPAAPGSPLTSPEDTSMPPASGSLLSSQRDDLIWALKDVSFEIKQGEVVGIIGRNGAGKSTLLKILSKITEPTSGRVEMRGRVGSLLEVGTGFHPELTGHENVYLYGAILGMDRWEITRKFDEIIAFAELEKFVDTPVKRYSSGMYMRLAFAVAAHLEPEILLVDEVLAVGDAEFQKKCLGKMEDTAKGGRTILFVSHNMTAISSLCNSAIWLDKSKMLMRADSQIAIQAYLSAGSEQSASVHFDFDSTKLAQIRKVELLDSRDELSSEFDILSDIKVRIEYSIDSTLYNHRIGVVVSRFDGLEVFVTNSTDKYAPTGKIKPGHYCAVLFIPNHLLTPGRYLLSIYLGEPNRKTHDRREHIIHFGITGNPYQLPEKRRGLLVYPFKWDFSILTQP